MHHNLHGSGVFYSVLIFREPYHLLLHAVFFGLILYLRVIHSCIFSASVEYSYMSISQSIHFIHYGFLNYLEFQAIMNKARMNIHIPVFQQKYSLSFFLHIHISFLYKLSNKISSDRVQPSFILVDYKIILEGFIPLYDDTSRLRIISFFSLQALYTRLSRK